MRHKFCQMKSVRPDFDIFKIDVLLLWVGIEVWASAISKLPPSQGSHLARVVFSMESMEGVPTFDCSTVEPPYTHTLSLFLSASGSP